MRSWPFIEGHDSCTTEPDVVLESSRCPIHLSWSSLTPQLPVEFGALGEASRPKGMPFRNQPA